MFQGYSHGTYVGLSAPGGHTLCSRVTDHGTYVGLSALGGSCTVFQGYRPWNSCSISLYNTYPVFVVIIQLGILIVFVDQRQRRPHLGT